MTTRFLPKRLGRGFVAVPCRRLLFVGLTVLGLAMLLSTASVPAAGHGRGLGTFGALKTLGSTGGNQAGHVVSTDGGKCPDGVCSIRLTQGRLTKSNTGWTVPSAAAAEWIAVQNPNCGSTNGGCIVQAGYGKWTAANAPTGCTQPNGTNGNVEVFYYSINASNGIRCQLGQTVSGGESHEFTISRCDSSASDWCSYLDGTQVPATYTNSGVGSVAPQAATAGEFTCATCMTSSTFISTNFGGLNSNPWQIGDLSGSPQAVTSGAPGFKVDDSNLCAGGGSEAHWRLDNISNTAPWTISWVSNGFNC